MLIKLHLAGLITYISIEDCANLKNFNTLVIVLQVKLFHLHRHPQLEQYLDDCICNEAQPSRKRNLNQSTANQKYSI